jgi:hypothetical protein
LLFISSTNNEYSQTCLVEQPVVALDQLLVKHQAVVLLIVCVLHHRRRRRRRHHHHLHQFQLQVRTLINCEQTHMHQNVFNITTQERSLQATVDIPQSVLPSSYSTKRHCERLQERYYLSQPAIKGPLLSTAARSVNRVKLALGVTTTSPVSAGFNFFPF